MADWSMEPTPVWVPCDLQLANWTMEPVVYAPCLSMEYASTNMFGSCIQTSAPMSNGQIVEYAAAVPISVPEQELEVHSNHMEIVVDNSKRVLKGAVTDVAEAEKPMKTKIHRYPESIARAGVLHKRGASATVPMVVAIGPYHHNQAHLKEAEKMKHAAAYHCIYDASHSSVQPMYDAVVAAAQRARGLYDKDVVAGISDDQFLPMMFYDACFLVQYMASFITLDIYPEMKPFCNFIDSNETDIFHDIMLLENQLPWPVVDAVLKFMSESPVQRFIQVKKCCLQDRKGNDCCTRRYETYENPPHLLGLLQHYIVGKSNPKETRPTPESVETKEESEDSISLTVGANEFAEMGIKFKANRTTEIIHMDLMRKWILLAELSLTPLSLDDVRASCLVNMAALELCRTPSFFDDSVGVGDEESAVCSYILLLASLVGREEDVHMLRKKHILQGGASLTDKEVLDFFTCFNGLRLGTCYVRTMKKIESYKSKRRRVIKVHAFLYNHWKFVTGFSSAIISVIAFWVKLTY